jgi:hypothetical protein
MNLFYTATDHFVLSPAIQLAFWGCAILLLDTWLIPDPRKRRWLVPIFVLPAIVLTAVALGKQHA